MAMRALYKGTPWFSGVNVAKCPFGYHLTSAPEPNCSCGFYGMYKYWQVESDLNTMGVIEATGRVILHSKGARVEKARIVAHMRPPQFYALRHHYPDVHWFDSEEDMLREYPPQDVSELIGPSPRRVKVAGKMIMPDGTFQEIEWEYDE